MRIVEASGGRVIAESEVERGAVFRVHLRVGDHHAAEARLHAR